MGVEVTVHGLTKSFGGQLVWADLSLTLPAGEVSVLLGPSGTGKSVFLKTLVGLLKPDRGSIWICLLYTSPSPRDRQKSRMPSSA